MTFDLLRSARCFILTVTRSSSQVKVMGQSSLSLDKNVPPSAVDARYDVTYFWSFVELFLMK